MRAIIPFLAPSVSCWVASRVRLRRIAQSIWIPQRLADAGLVKGKTIAIDATTLEANAALRSIVRRDTGATYQEVLMQLAQASGVETPTHLLRDARRMRSILVEAFASGC